MGRTIRKLGVGSSGSYEIILPPLESFSESLKHYFSDPRTQEKIMKRINDMLPIRPYRYGMLSTSIKISGVNLSGLRHIKVGVEGIKTGAVVYYRICEECKKNKYDLISRIRCNFCKDQNGKHIALFLVRPRSSDYT